MRIIYLFIIFTFAYWIMIKLKFKNIIDMENDFIPSKKLNNIMD